MSKGPGRGKRVCAGCKKVIGARTILCACGVAKPKRALSAAEPVVNQGVTVTRSETLVRVPSGAPPIKWIGMRKSSVIEWIEATISYGKSDFKIYTEESMLYFLKLTLGIHSNRYKKCSKYIIDYFANLESSKNADIS